MRTIFSRFFLALTASLLFLVTPVSASEYTNGSASYETQELFIDGQAFQAELVPSQVSSIENAGGPVHYKGQISDDPDSWVRVSRIDGGWQGLVFAFGRLHTIRSGGQHEPVMSFSPIQEEVPQCGMDHMEAGSSITTESLSSPAMAQAVSANYDSLCADRVDGACLMMELELAFDLQFQARFPMDFESRAGAIINMVEGFYEAQFGIVFDTLSLTFITTPEFSATNDASELLNDITSKRRDGQVSFLKSSRSIFHFVSGRDFNGSTAGLAWVGTLCDGSGYATGISQASDSIATTAVIVAHEIGHNLSASHDRPLANGCPSGTYIMSAYVSGDATAFSSCSYTSITDKISSLGNVEQCFNFPADTSIEALAGNATEVAEGSVFKGYFDVVYEDASQSADRLVVQGSIGDDEGFLHGVSLNGAACTLTSDTEFRCPETAVMSRLGLYVEVVAGSTPTLNLVQGVALRSDRGEVKDIVSSNDTLLTQVAVTPGDANVPEDLPEFNPPPSDSSGGPTLTPSRTTDAGSSDSGGGGALGAIWLLVGLAGLFRKRARKIKV